MSFFSILLIAIGLSMDACAVAICNAMAIGSKNQKSLLILPFAFGGFQALMPLLGYAPGSLLTRVIGDHANVLVAMVLTVIGLKMLLDARHHDKIKKIKHLGIALIFVQAIATAIDAFFVGVGFGAMHVPIWSSAVIGLTTFILVLFAIKLGRLLSSRLGQKSELLGGVLLIIIGLLSLIS